MRFWAATLLCGATGCAQIFGLDTTTGAADANVDRTSIQLTRVSVGAGVVRNPLDLSMQTATFYADDGAGGYTEVPGENGPVDTFSAAITTGTPPVRFTTPDMATHFWALPARAQKSNFAFYEHPNPVAAAATSAISLSVTLPSPWVAADSFQLFIVGAWTQHGLSGPDLPAIGPDMGVTTIAPQAPIQYSAFTNAVGGALKTAFNASDAILFLRYDNGSLTGVFQAPQMDQTTGTDTLTGTMTAVPQTQTLNASIDPTGYGTRYSAVRPANAGLAMSWRLGACPGWSLALDGGCVRLNSGVASMMGTTIGGTYGNPFEGLDWKTLLTFSTSSSRTATFNGVMVPLGSVMTTVSEPMAGLALNLPAGLPITVRANLTNLTSDGMSLTLDLTKPVAIDAIIDKPASTTSMYVMSLVEVDTTGGMLARKIITDGVTVGDGVFKLPPDMFQAGHSYYVEYRTYVGGFTNAAMGDTTTVTLPYTTAMTDSGIFTVVAQ